MKFCLHVFLFLALPQQKYPHLVIPTGGPVDRSGGICFSESDTCCRCPDAFLKAIPVADVPTSPGMTLGGRFADMNINNQNI